MAADEKTVNEVNDLVERSGKALKILKGYNQEQIDNMCEKVALAVLDHHMEIAQLAVKETQRGVVEDKAIKNIFASDNIWSSMRHDKTVGIIDDDKQERLIKVAEPLGIVAGVTPVTNPTSTVIFNTLISLKARNTIVFGFHPQAQKCCALTADIMREAIRSVGGPEDAVNYVHHPSLEATNSLMKHPDVATIVATGGPGMVKAAYTSGKPALGVGPGNGPTYIEKTADIKQSVNDIVLSKTFDNGMVCASENSAVVDNSIYDQVRAEFKRLHCYFVKPEDVQKLTEAVIDPKRHTVRGPIAGKSAYYIAQQAGLKDVKPDVRVLIAEINGVGLKYPLSGEKLSPVLTMYHAKDHEDAFKICDDLLHYGGLGHTAGIHTKDDQLADKFGIKMPACRILVNTPSAVGGIGGIYNNMKPSLTLGTGSYGENSISHNITEWDLLNIKTIAKRRNNMQWIKLPPKIYFERESLRYLAHMPNVKRAFVVCDPGMMKLGYTDRVVDMLNRRRNHVEVSVFSDVEPNPSTNTVYKGVAQMKNFDPDTIIAVGGGSAIDAAKGMWLFYEHPEASFEGAKQKFLDIRKRTYRVPTPKKTKMVAIPTTSGTGSEVTPYAVITDSDTHVKYPVTDYALQPDVAIVDSQFVDSLPKKAIAYPGLDVITHATESYVSTMASDFTRGWSLQAIKLAFKYLVASYNGDEYARGKMHDASTLAGMAFANAFLGITHSLAHKAGGEFNLPHGLAIAISYPQVVRYNSEIPTKLAMWPKYNHNTALHDYADLARALHLEGNTDEELKESLVKAYIKIAHELGVTLSFKANGVSKDHFDKSLDHMSELAYEDQCTPSNPREPLISELKELYKKEWLGDGVEVPAKKSATNNKATK